MNQEFNYEEAKSLASNLKTSSNNVKDLLDRSDSVVKEVKNNWQGSSAQYAIEDWDKWKKDFDEYYQMLIANVKNIESACEEFTSAEARMQSNYQ